MRPCLWLLLTADCALFGGVEGDYHLRPESAGTAGSGSGAGGDGAGGVGAQGGAGGASDAPLCVSVGDHHSCAIRADHTLWCWGRNGESQIGDGSTGAPKLSPVEITALGAPVAQAAPGAYHSCARKTDQTLWCWGDNLHGSVGDGTTDTPKPSPIEVTSLGTEVAEVATGNGHTCARKTDGTAWCWGFNLQGQVGNASDTPQPSPVEVEFPGANDVAQLALGDFHSCALKTDGTLWCWGSNLWGELGTGEMSMEEWVPVLALVEDVALVAAGGAFTCARKTDGSAWCWGENSYGQLGDGGLVQSTADAVHVEGLGGTVRDLALGFGHSCAILTDDTLWCWGRNNHGQLGRGFTSASEVQPAQVLDAVAHVALGVAHSCASQHDGSIWCWGENTNAELGDGTMDTPKTSPILVGVTCR